MKTKMLCVAMLITIATVMVYGSWDNDKPADSDAWNVAAGYIRDNWDALEAALGTDLDMSTISLDMNDIIVTGPYVDVRAYLPSGFVTDGSVDYSTEFNNALDEGRTNNKPVIVPYGQYLIDTELNCFRVSMIGLPSSGDLAAGAFHDSEWPTIVGGTALTSIIRVGQNSDSSDTADRSTLANFIIDMTGSPASAKGVYCEYGLNFKTIKNIYIRGAADTRANLITTNQTGFRLVMTDTSTQGLYYMNLHNLTGFYLFRGFYTEGHSNDGMRQCDIGMINAAYCPQGITFKDTSYNDIGILACNYIISGYDPTGASPTDWCIYMNYENNNIGVINIEGIADATAPHTFISARHSISMYRYLDYYPNSIQNIDDSDNRIVSSSAGNNRSFISGPEMVEVGTLGGVQTQDSLIVNPHFQHWSDVSGANSADVADAETFSYVWTAIKDGTGTLKLAQQTGNSHAWIYDCSVDLQITTPQANNLYGFKQDLEDYYTLNGTTITTIGRIMEYVTVAVRVKPYSNNAGNTKFRIAWDQGTATGNEDYIINYTHTTSGVDEKVIGADGSWWTLIHQINCLATATKFEISVGLYPADTVTVGCYIDSVVVIAGRHTQYGTHPFVKVPELLHSPYTITNVNTPSGATAKALPIFDKDGAVLGYIPVYTAEW